MITEVEYAHFKELGLDKISVDAQYALLTKGVQPAALSKPALLNDGIEPLAKEEAEKLATLYEKESPSLSVIKFVPASGAATRMFKDLATFTETGIETEPISHFFNSFATFPFAASVPEELSNLKKAEYLLKILKFKTTPKGLIPFHQYKGFTRTAFKEHWIEGLHYAATKGEVNLHFTVSENHQVAFARIYDTRITAFSKEYGKKLNIEFSQQDKSTDTLLVNNEGEILKDVIGKPITRPGGHGALINNLNQLSADLVFVKNIDNVVHQNHLEATTLYKKALGGRLIELKNKLFSALKSIEAANANLSSLEILGKESNIIAPSDYPQFNNSEKISFWKTKFNRPIRVCGMVKNLGEPGGGPFWVQQNNIVSLQIIESAQIDNTNAKQTEILNSSTHFNPVDLVCYIADYKGNKFNLLNYIDEASAFITSKNVNGEDVNVLEHPGLWNGAMADWTTLFVEVPIETFNPVKTVNDLLKTSHLA